MIPLYTWDTFLTESAEIFSFIGSIVNSIPFYLQTLVFVPIAFAVVMSIVNDIRGLYK